MQIINTNKSKTLMVFLALISFAQLSMGIDNHSVVKNTEASPISQLAKITAANGDEGRYQILPLGGRDLVEGDQFSFSMDMYEDTLVIGAPGEDSNASGINGDETDNSNRDSGAVYVFKNINGQWQQQFYIKGSDLSPNDGFGYSVAIDGNIMAIGTNTTENVPGKVYLFELNQGQWQQRTIIEPNSNQRDGFGTSVFLDGHTLAIGAPYNNSSSAIDDTDISVRASGAVYVYQIGNDFINQVAFLKAPDPQLGASFGSSIAVSNDTLVVGEPNRSLSDVTQTFSPGAAYVYEFEVDEWRFSQALSPQFNMLPNFVTSRYAFGRSVAISGNKIVVGAPQEQYSDTGFDVGIGVVHVFERETIDSQWIDGVQLVASNADLSDYFGWSVAINNNTIVVGATGEDGVSPGVNGDVEDNSARDSGAVYVFQKDNLKWNEIAYVKSEQPSISDRFLVSPDNFGSSVLLSDKYLVVGSPNEQLATGAVRVFSSNFTPINKSHTGLWFDKNEPGHNFSFYLLKDDRVVAIWNTYDNTGNQMWLVGVGTHDGYTAQLDVHVRSGGSFPPINSDAQVKHWGKFEITFNDCKQGYFSWTPDADTGFEVGNTSISRLTTTEGITCGETLKNSNAPFGVKDSNSALWFNPAGEFLMNTFMLKNNRIVHMWYTFDNNNNPIWIQGIGTHDGTKASMDAYIFDGGKFPPNYIDAEVMVKKWGTFELEYSDCENGHFKWQPAANNGFDSGETSIKKLTKTRGLDCTN